MHPYVSERARDKEGPEREEERRKRAAGFGLADRKHQEVRADHSVHGILMPANPGGAVPVAYCRS